MGDESESREWFMKWSDKSRERMNHFKSNEFENVKDK